MCALSLYTGFPFNLDLCRATTSMYLNTYFFSPSFKKWLGNKDASQTTGKNTYCVKMRTEMGSPFLSPPAVMLPLKPGNRDMTTQSNNKKYHCTFGINSSAVQTCLPHKKHQKILSCMYRRPTKKVEGVVYKDVSGCMEESVGPVWSPPSS